MRVAGALVVLGLLIASGPIGSARQLPLAPVRERGQGISPAFEGWFKNADGSFTLLIGYYNRNVKETMEIPIGPNNRIEPGGPDLGQPSSFLPRRQYGVFTINVPKDFGSKKLTWTIVANGETNAIPLSLHTSYEVAPYRDIAMENTPPVVKFSQTSTGVTGPPIGFAASFNATVSNPLPLIFWVSDRPGKETAATARGRSRSGAPVTVALSLYRGPGSVTFSDAAPKVDLAADGKTSAEATFSAPGEYILRVQVNDASGEGGGGFQCCWTNAHLKVNVRPAGGAQ